MISMYTIGLHRRPVNHTRIPGEVFTDSVGAVGKWGRIKKHNFKTRSLGELRRLGTKRRNSGKYETVLPRPNDDSDPLILNM